MDPWLYWALDYLNDIQDIMEENPVDMTQTFVTYYRAFKAPIDILANPWLRHVIDNFYYNVWENTKKEGICEVTKQGTEVLVKGCKRSQRLIFWLFRVEKA